jgi:hypothetical protein
VPGEIAAPSYEGVLEELFRVREKGLGQLRHYSVLQLHAACRLIDLTDSAEQEPAAIEALIRQAIEALGGGTLGDVAEYTFGLLQGTKLLPAPERRKRAAKAQNVSVDRFRKAYERPVIEQVAEGVLALCHNGKLRQARVDMERRHPADSRLAVQWVERFEAYNRIWTPVWKLAADLEAAIDTRYEQPSEHLPWDPNSARAFDPEDQASGYARFALHAYAWYQLELKKFMTRHGGLWLLSDADAEVQASDAIYRIGWHNPLNEEDDSWLRRQLADSRHEEQEHFAHLLDTVGIGQRIHAEWQEYVAGCMCPSIDGPVEGCQPHAAIAACKEYCELIDSEWLKIADWYRPGSRPARGVDPRELYDGRLQQKHPSGIGE